MSRREELENSMYYKSTVTVDMRVFIGVMLRDISVSLAILADEMKEIHENQEEKRSGNM